MEKNAVRVGFSRADITPLESVPLAGYGNTERRMSGAILSRLYATCLAFSDGENKALLISLDNAGFSDLSDEVVHVGEVGVERTSSKSSLFSEIPHGHAGDPLVGDEGAPGC